MRAVLALALVSAAALAPVAAAQDPQCYWHPTFREFVWWISMNTVYLEDGSPTCSASLHSPGPFCTLLPREAVWQATFRAVLVAEDCTPTVSDPECPAGGEWPTCH